MTGLTAPLKRTVRPFVGGSYTEGGGLRYLRHPNYAQDGAHYVRSFAIIQKQLQDVFEYVEPDDINATAYSFRVMSLLVTTCVEIEASFKAILTENGYGKSGNLDMSDYSRIERTHRLSEYRIRIPYWKGLLKERKPFGSWASPGGRLSWYQAYNSVKHDRHSSFKLATFEHLTDAVCGLFALLSSQFHSEDFAPGSIGLSVGSRNSHPDFDFGIGDFLEIAYPSSWLAEECYSFDATKLDFNDTGVVQSIDYSRVSSV